MMSYNIKRIYILKMEKLIKIKKKFEIKQSKYHNSNKKLKDLPSNYWLGNKKKKEKRNKKCQLFKNSAKIKKKC